MKGLSILSMRERIAAIYKNKAPYYLEVLDSFDREGIEYVLLNVEISDNNPGDLDILIINSLYKKITHVLENKGYSYYTKYETGQYLWNKYISNVGFVQVHCYMKFAFQGKNYLKGYSLSSIYSTSVPFQFYVFLIESFFKGKRRDTQIKMYLKHSSKQDVLSFAKSVSLESLSICTRMLDVYDGEKEITKQRNILSSFGRLLKRLKRLFNKEDKRVLFIGVDGAGKSSIVDGVYAVFSKGGIYPRKIYLGLRNSKLNQNTSNRKENCEATEKNRHKSNRKTNKKVLRLIKLMLYWIEYNFKYILFTYIPNSAYTVYLIDRCYIDLLRYYHTRFAKWLILKASLYPNRIVLLTGDREIIYNRKKEFTSEEFDRIYTFYSQIEGVFVNKRNKSLITLDTTSNTLEESIFEVCNFVMK